MVTLAFFRIGQDRVPHDMHIHQDHNSLSGKYTRNDRISLSYTPIIIGSITLTRTVHITILIMKLTC